MTAPEPLTFAAGIAEVTFAATTADNGDRESARAVVFRLLTNEDFPHYTLGSTAEQPAAATVTVLDDDTPPTMPENFIGATNDGRIDLTWDPPLSDGGQPIEKYQYRVRVGQGGWNPDWTDVPDSGEDGANRGSYTVTGLTNDTEYEFQLRAANGAPYRNEDEVAVTRAVPREITVPDAPREMLLANADGALVLQWSPPAWDGGQPILHYERRLDTEPFREVGTDSRQRAGRNQSWPLRDRASERESRVRLAAGGEQVGWRQLRPSGGVCVRGRARGTARL